MRLYGYTRAKLSAERSCLGEELQARTSAMSARRRCESSSTTKMGTGAVSAHQASRGARPTSVKHHQGTGSIPSKGDSRSDHRYHQLVQRRQRSTVHAATSTKHQKGDKSALQKQSQAAQEPHLPTLTPALTLQGRNTLHPWCDVESNVSPSKKARVKGRC